MSMHNLAGSTIKLPAGQQSIQARCHHPTGTFVEFTAGEVEQSMPECIEQQGRLYADRLAIKTNQFELTYAELNQAANRLAHRVLSHHGAKAEPVALLCEHDAQMIVAMLGVMKTGKFYVPLDPTYPRPRLAYMLDDSQAELIVTDSWNLPLARELSQNSLQVINLDDLASNAMDENPDVAISPEAISHIMYTSGSTGQAKGVVLTHRAVLHDIRNYTNSCHICAHDRLTLLHSCSYGSATIDIYCALFKGAALFPYPVKKEGLDNLAEWLIKENITIVQAIPTLFRHFANTLTGKEEFPDLRVLHIGGEPVSKREVDLYKPHFSSNTIFVNRVGTTETRTFRWNFIDKTTQIHTSIVPVGYVVEGQEVLLLDEDREKVGINTVGEIAIKSRYLSPGYWQNPDLTWAKFIPDPNGGAECIYLTGDLGIMRPDGCLEYLGRKDFQVKIRGHRIEIPEIELTLLDLDNVKEAIVIARDGKAGDQRLVAYIVPIKQPAPTASALREALSKTLPDYMLPSVFMVMDALPQTPNGKLDRTKLPAPDQTRPKLETPFITPRTPVEEVMARVWSGVLGLDEVGMHDNFLELGGDSLLAMQVISRVNDLFQLEAPLHDILEAATVAEMSGLIDNEADPGRAEKIASVFKRLENMSIQEIRDMIEEKRKDGE